MSEDSTKEQPSLKLDPISKDLTLIKKIQELRKELKVLLDSDIRDAFESLGYAINALKNEDFESAYSELTKVMEYTIQQYSQMKTFKRKVYCKIMTIFSIHMIQCYNKEKKSFDDLLSLPQDKQKSLAETVQSDVDIIFEEFSMVHHPNWWQKYINKLLKVALPIIWHQNELFRVKHYQDKDLLKYLPDNKEDAAEILLEGKWPIRVWREQMRWLCFEFQYKNSVDDGIKKTDFHCIASNVYCKYSTINSLFYSTILYDETCF